LLIFKRLNDLREYSLVTAPTSVVGLTMVRPWRLMLCVLPVLKLLIYCRAIIKECRFQYCGRCAGREVVTFWWLP
ncbi:hypothetical protein, partial [Photobacterium sanguinicancri]|uniref:hypothetical protein n=1 Tax=Photobacterium sanguinicancri TaxID=875932 RepID=UPI0026E33057